MFALFRNPQYASYELRNDLEVLMATSGNFSDLKEGRDLVLSSDRLRTDREFALELFKHNIIWEIPKEFRNREFMLEAINRNCFDLGLLRGESEEILLEAIKQDARFFYSSVSKSARDDPEFVFKAVAINGHTLEFVSSTFKQ